MIPGWIQTSFLTNPNFSRTKKNRLAIFSITVLTVSIKCIAIYHKRVKERKKKETDISCFCKTSNAQSWFCTLGLFIMYLLRSKIKGSRMLSGDLLDRKSCILFYENGWQNMTNHVPLHNCDITIYQLYQSKKTVDENKKKRLKKKNDWILKWLRELSIDCFCSEMNINYSPHMYDSVVILNKNRVVPCNAWLFPHCTNVSFI